MNKTAAELKTTWQKEKGFYRKVEVGTGVQSFIKNILESEEIFNLKEGKLSTEPEQRKNEFIHEKRAKEKRKADFVIYINPEIIIPVEAECYGKIEGGESQLFSYQKDFDKQYGILTDGYTWRFYNNNIFRSFTIKDILDKTTLFLEFWKEYIKPEFYYLSFFEPIGQLTLLEETKLHVEENRQLFFEDITKRIESFKNKLHLEGYLKDLDKKEREKKATEIAYAYIIQFILYKVLVDNEFNEFAEEFEASVSKIYENLKKQGYKDILGIIDNMSAKISKNIYRPFAEEQKFIRERLLELYRSVENKLSDVSPWLDIFVFIKKYNFADVQNEIFGYIYENYLKELYEEGRKGQYFTDPAVVNFMLNAVGYTPDNIRRRYGDDKDSVSLIDPSCGSGTFLYAATDAVVKAFPGSSEQSSRKVEDVVTKNVFGLDIEEFPLYLAEINILMRMLPLIIGGKYNNPVDKKIKVFKTRDSVAEFMNTDIRNTFNDIEIEFKKSNGQLGLFTKKLDLGYSSYVRDEDNLNEMKETLETRTRCPRRRFDFVIGNPPYVSFKQCSKQKVLFFELMKQRKLKLSNIYGVNLHSVPDRPKKYAPNPNLYAFFIALGLALLKDEGKLCFIIPQTILTAGDLDVLRYHLAKFTTIEKIVVFGGKMFVGRGLRQTKQVATSSLIFVVRREQPKLSHQVEILYYRDPSGEIDRCLTNISKGKKVTKKKIRQQDLLVNVANWSFIKQGKLFSDFWKEYRINAEDISVYYDHILAQDRFGSLFYFDRGLKFPKSKITQFPQDRDGYFVENHYKTGFRSFASPNFIQTTLLDFPYGSQGEIVYKQKYKIVWSYINHDRFRFSEDKIMVDYNSVLISSNNREELFYLLSILNSALTTKIVDALFRSEHEKDVLIGIKTIKEFVRVPKINGDNQFVKNKVIKLTEKMLELEKVGLPDLVDFSGVLRQKFDKIYVEKDKLVLEKDKEKIKLDIKKNKSLVEKVIKENFEQPGLELEKRKIILSELESLPAIDFGKQQQIKDHIDDLVFCLYFNIEVPKDKLSKPEFIKKLCQENKFYDSVS